jgi:hypothetical protein
VLVGKSKTRKGDKNMSEAIKKNAVIVDSNYPGSSNTCNVREPRESDAAALAAGRVFARELPLSGEWQACEEYEWGHQKALCYARWNKHTTSVQIAKAHGSDEDLCLDKLGNLWKCYWNPEKERWDPVLIG